MRSTKTGGKCYQMLQLVESFFLKLPHGTTVLRGVLFREIIDAVSEPWVFLPFGKTTHFGLLPKGVGEDLITTLHSFIFLANARFSYIKNQILECLTSRSITIFILFVNVPATILVQIRGQNVLHV